MHMMDRRTIGEDGGRRDELFFNSTAWKAITTPNRRLQQRSFAPQSRGSRISERDDCAKSTRFRGVSSAGDAPGTEWLNE